VVPTPSTEGNCNGSEIAADGASDPFYASQWHLSNAGVANSDLNLGAVWTTNKGKNIRVNVVDDGMQILHEDLATNVTSNGGLNFWVGYSGFSTSATNPTPPSSGTLAHGTAVSGLIAGRDMNGIGIRGVAPRACLAGVNLIANAGATSTQAGQSMVHDLSHTFLSNNSWGPTDKLGTLVASPSLWQSGITTASSVAFGWAAGNGARTNEAVTTGFETDNSNYDGYANHPGVMAICGVKDNGVRVHYSEKGANLWVCGFSETTTYNVNARGLTTTDLAGNVGFNTYSASTDSDTSLATIGSTYFDYRHGSYTRIMNGTSGATPLVVGAAALIAKENSLLTNRDIRLILAESARQTDASDADWATNQGTKVSGAGHYAINHKYGFGLVDVDAAVTLARTWTPVVALQTAYDSGTVSVAQAFADNDSNGITHAIVVSGNAIERIEFVEVYLTATGDITDLDVRLTNTVGTESVLAEAHNCYASSSSSTVLSSCGQTYSAWRFGSARHLGESANQTWTLRVSDRRTGTTTAGGSFTSWRLKIHGRAS